VLWIWGKRWFFFCASQESNSRAGGFHHRLPPLDGRKVKYVIVARTSPLVQINGTRIVIIIIDLVLVVVYMLLLFVCLTTYTFFDY